MLFDGITIRHSRDVVRNTARLIVAVPIFLGSKRTSLMKTENRSLMILSLFASYAALDNAGRDCFLKIASFSRWAAYISGEGDEGRSVSDIIEAPQDWRERYLRSLSR